MPPPANTPDGSPTEVLLPIRTVSALTGVNSVTLRAWERRYGLVKPQRTPKGHRLYSQRDVERIKQIVSLLGQGLAVSRVKPLLEHTPGDMAKAPGDRSDSWTGYRDNMLLRIEQFDEPAMDAIYNDALSLYPIDIVNRQLTKPLLRLLGERWDKRPAGIAEEHFFSHYLRNKLGSRIHYMNQRHHGPLLLLACMPGEQHEIGLLFFALAAIDAGYRVLTLGASTPLHQIPAVHESKPCTAVVLSSTAKISRKILDETLTGMVGQLDVPVFIGGYSSISQHDEIEKTGAACLGDSIASSLQLVTQMLESRRPR